MMIIKSPLPIHLEEKEEIMAIEAKEEKALAKGYLANKILPLENEGQPPRERWLLQ
jgi:hypothetical protein